jgi:hypothetical protein
MTFFINASFFFSLPYKTGIFQKEGAGFWTRQNSIEITDCCTTRTQSRIHPVPGTPQPIEGLGTKNSS